MLAALRAAQNLLQPGGLLETSFSLKEKSSYRLFKKRQNVISSSPTGVTQNTASSKIMLASFDLCRMQQFLARRLLNNAYII